MIKLIFKSLWARRGRNIWVLLELVIVSAILWAMLDPIVINTYIKNYDPGYYIDPLVTVDVASYTDKMPAYDPDQDNPDAKADNLMRMLQRLREVEGVETATIAPNGNILNGMGASMNQIRAKRDTTLEGMVYLISFVPNTDYFRTYGIRTVDGKDFYEEPEALNGSWVVTKTYAKAMYEDEAAVGRLLFDRDKDVSEYTEEEMEQGIIADVVGDVVNYASSPRSLVAFRKEKLGGNYYQLRLVARKAEGISTARLIENIGKACASDLKAGNYYARNPQPYSSLVEWRTYDMDNKIVLGYAVAIFFLVNICLALVATFYMQTRSRSKDAGIMRAYGFRKRTMVWIMIAEGWVLTFIAWILGTILALWYLGKDGLTTDWTSGKKFFEEFMPMWYDNYAVHVGAISAMSLVIMLVIVTIGIWLPARRIAAVNPVDTLRDY